MSVIDRLSYVIEADTAKFRDGATATRRELKAIAEIADSTRTPLEKYQAAVRNLDSLLAKGGITAEQHRRAMASLKHEYDANATAAAAAAEKVRAAELAKVKAAEEAAAKMRAIGLAKDRAAMAAGARAVAAEREADRIALGRARSAVEFGGVALGGAAAAGLARGVSLAAEAEQSQVAFRVMLQDASRARELLQGIRSFAASTPMQFGELRDATRMLIAFGESDKTVLETLRRLGDVAAGTGQQIGELAEIYGKMRVQGRAYAEDINQFQGRGIPIVQELAKVLGVAQDEIRGMVTNGKIGFTEIEAAFRSMASEGGKFGGMMDEQAQTLSGKWSTFKDDLDEIARSVAEDLVPALKETLPVLREMASLTGDVARFTATAVETYARPGAVGAKPGEGKLTAQIAELEGQATDIVLATRGRARTTEEQDKLTEINLKLNRLREERDFLRAGIEGRPWERAAEQLSPIVEADKFDMLAGDKPKRSGAKARDGLSAKDLIAQGGIGEKFGAELLSAGLKGGDLAYRKADQLGNRQDSIFGALGGIGASLGGGLLGGVTAAGEGLGVGVAGAALITQMKTLIAGTDGPITVGAAAKLKGSQEAFAADRAHALGQEKDEAKRIMREQLKALMEIAAKMGVMVPAEITGAL